MTWGGGWGEGRGGEWNRQEGLALAAASGLPVLDLTQGVASDPPPLLRGPCEPSVATYPLSAGSDELRAAAVFRLRHGFGVELAPDAVAACVGTKEFIATLPLFLRRMRPPGRRDTVLVPALGYPPYAYGAELAGLRVVRVPMDDQFRMRLDALPPHEVHRALCLWVNSPANPTGVVETLDRIARWGRRHGVLVLSDEAYADAAWDGPPRTVLDSGPAGVLAVHSLSKRSNSPHVRAGFYAGDPDLVSALVGLRRQAGFLPGAADQSLAVRLLRDERHAEAHHRRCRRRVLGLLDALRAAGLPCARPQGGPFLWLRVPDGSDLAFARRAAATAGLVVMPGSCYAPAGRNHVRIAASVDARLIAPRFPLLRSADLAEA